VKRTAQITYTAIEVMRHPVQEGTITTG